jgi:hypothetical protein
MLIRLHGPWVGFLQHAERAPRSFLSSTGPWCLHLSTHSVARLPGSNLLTGSRVFASRKPHCTPVPLHYFSFPYALLRLPAFVPSSILLPICFAVSPSCVRGIAEALYLSRVAASPRSLYFLATLNFAFDLVATLSAHNTPSARYCTICLFNFPAVL